MSFFLFVLQAAAPMQGRADRKRKVALLLAYCGAGYYGIQIQKYVVVLNITSLLH